MAAVPVGAASDTHCRHGLAHGFACRAARPCDSPLMRLSVRLRFANSMSDAGVNPSRTDLAFVSDLVSRRADLASPPLLSDSCPGTRAKGATADLIASTAHPYVAHGLMVQAWLSRLRLRARAGSRPRAPSRQERMAASSTGFVLPVPL